MAHIISLIIVLPILGVTIGMMLKTFRQYEDKGQSSVRQKAMLTLIEGFSGDEILTQEKAEKVQSSASESEKKDTEFKLYHKNLKNLDTRKNCCNYSKFYVIFIRLSYVLSGVKQTDKKEMHLTASKKYTFSYCVYFQGSLSSLSHWQMYFLYSIYPLMM